MKTYSVYTNLDTAKSPSKKMVELKAESFFQAAVNAAHFFGWANTDGMTLTLKQNNDLREYRLGSMVFDVVLRAA